MAKYSYENDYVVTDLLLSAKRDEQTEFSHIAYYNMFEEKLQSDDVVYNVPFYRFIYTKSVDGQDFIIDGRKVNMAFISHGHSDRSIITAMNDKLTHINYIPACIHLQKIKVKINYPTKLGTIKTNTVRKQKHEDVLKTFIAIMKGSDKDYSKYIKSLLSTPYVETAYVIDS